MNKATRINERQAYLLRQIVIATDGRHPVQLSGAAEALGLCVHGPTVAALVRRELIECVDHVNEVDGDGRLVREDAPLYAATPAGRAATPNRAVEA